MQLHITHPPTALAVKLLFIKLQISVHVGIEFYITIAIGMFSMLILLPPSSEGWGKVLFSQASVCPHQVGRDTWPG